MTQIKSENAKQYMHDKIPWVWMAATKELVIIAETEADQRHAKEMQQLKDKAVKEFCKGMCDERKCRAYNDKCMRVKLFTQKLNEK